MLEIFELAYSYRSLAKRKTITISDKKYEITYRDTSSYVTAYVEILSTEATIRNEQYEIICSWGELEHNAIKILDTNTGKTIVDTKPTSSTLCIILAKPQVKSARK